MKTILTSAVVLCFACGGCGYPPRMSQVDDGFHHYYPAPPPKPVWEGLKTAFIFGQNTHSSNLCKAIQDHGVTSAATIEAAKATFQTAPSRFVEWPAYAKGMQERLGDKYIVAYVGTDVVFGMHGRAMINLLDVTSLTENKSLAVCLNAQGFYLNTLVHDAVAPKVDRFCRAVSTYGATSAQVAALCPPTFSDLKGTSPGALREALGSKLLPKYAVSINGGEQFSKAGAYPRPDQGQMHCVQIVGLGQQKSQEVQVLINEAGDFVDYAVINTF